MGIYTSYIDRCYSECNYDYTKELRLDIIA